MRVHYQSLKDVVLSSLRREVIEGLHKPGTHLVEQALADEYGVSRGPVREAILQLETEGLVRVLPRRGAVVTELSPREAYEIYKLRGYLERLAVQTPGFKLHEGDMARLQSMLAEMESLAVDDWMPAIQLDLDFHHVIVEGSNNRTLVQLYNSLDSKVIACFLAVRRHLGAAPNQMADRHGALVEALRGSDYARAESLAFEHWFETAVRFQALIPKE